MFIKQILPAILIFLVCGSSLLFYSNEVDATAYYVNDTSGNDTYNGLYPAYTSGSNGPYKTLTKIAGHTWDIHEGDTIYFNRGDIFRGGYLYIDLNGTASKPITVDAYGTGADPILSPSIKSSSTGDWYQCSTNSTPSTGCATANTNIWRFQNATWFNDEDCGSLIFGGMGTETGIGKKKQSYSQLTSNGDFWWDEASTQGYVLVYSDQNPVTKWTEMDLAITIPAIDIEGADCANLKQYITIQNIDVSHGGGNGVFLKNVKGTVVQNLDISFIGGGDQYHDYTTQFGEGLEVNNCGYDLTIYNNRLSQVNEGAISIQSSAEDNVQHDINIYYNSISKVASALVYLSTKASSTTDNIKFEYNTVTDLGNNYWQGYTWSGGAWAHICLFQIAGTITNPVYFRYNTFSGGITVPYPPVSDWAGAGANFIRFYREADYSTSKVIIDYNTYNMNIPSRRFAWIRDATKTQYEATKTDVDAWKAISGQDAHSTFNWTGSGHYFGN